MKNLKKLFGLFKNKAFRRMAIAVVVLIILAGAVLYYLKTVNRVFIDDSLIQTPIVSVTASVPGALNEIDVTENQTVKKGDALATVGTQVLRAPSDGIIVSANKQIGSQISAANNAVQMVNPEDFRVEGTLDENKGLKDIRAGQVASFTVDAFPGQTFWGYVDSVSPTAKQTQLSFSISSDRPTQQFTVSVKYDVNHYPQIKNGMSAKLVVFTATN